jgi:hypothetical protein
MTRMGATLLVSVLGVLACTQSPTGPAAESLLGIIVPWGGDEPQIAIRPTADAVRVTVVTYGDGCDSMGETVVTIREGTIEVTPRDVRTTVPGGGCADVRPRFEHDVTIGLDAARPWTVVVRGRRADVGDTIVVTRTIE